MKLDANIKEQLVGNDWQLPDFGSEKVPVEEKSLHEKKQRCSVGIFTHPKDFSNIQRIFKEDLKLTEEDGFIRMVDTQPRVINDGAPPVERTNTKVRIQLILGF